MRKLQRVLATGVLAACCTFAAAGTWAADAPLSDAEVSARAKALVAKMTPEEKAGQLTQFFFFGEAMGPLGKDPRMRKQLEDGVAAGNVGSLALVYEPALANRMQRTALQSRMKIPLIMGFDVIHGLRTIFPVPLAMAASWDPALAERAQSVAASEARAVGIHWAFAPMSDICRDPRWGRVVEGLGEDPYLASKMVAAQVRGFQGPHIGAPGHILSGPKHFAGYGASMGGRDFDEAEISDHDLWNTYLPPFKAAVDAGAGNIMAAYMSLNGVPAAGNRWLLTKVLRETWGFKGFVVSDNSSVRSLARQGVAADDKGSAERALTAGLDMSMGMPPYDKPVMGTLPQSLQDKHITAAELDRAVQRILEIKIRMGLFENPFVDEAKAESVLNDPAHHTEARIAAERSAVLLKNEGSLLPLDRAKITSLAVIGPLADSQRDVLGSWVFPFNKPRADSILAGLRAKLDTAVRIDYSEGVRMPPRLYPSPLSALEPRLPARAPLDETAEIARAAKLAQQADATVLVLGEAQDMSGETASRDSFELPRRQQELLDAVVATGKPVIVLLMSARPLNLHDTKAQAILDLWYPGSEGAAAAANLLFGDATPGGKLPFTWVRSAAQVPMTYSRIPSHSAGGWDRRYWNGPNTPTYVFGHGLSYTTFAYSGLSVGQQAYKVGEPVTVNVELKNTGARAGDEVAQLYIHQRTGVSSRPVRLLKGFQRVALQPGETRRLTFSLTADDLHYWSAETRDWVQDASVFDVWVGGSSAANLAGSFEVKRR
jgi:beta-glucosidase